ncbi:MAG: GGDEF domain-containing protein [Bacteroidaceae bacterium]|nr:GGDEF domain-containing protein [Bacteroidaceae bacterium]
MYFFYGNSRIIYYCLIYLTIGLFYKQQVKVICAIAYTLYNIGHMTIFAVYSPYGIVDDSIVFTGEIVGFFIVAIAIFFLSNAASSRIMQQGEQLSRSNKMFLRSQALIENNLAMLEIDLITDTFEIVYVVDKVREAMATNSNSIQENLYDAILKLCSPMYQSRMKEFYNLNTVEERLKGKKSISFEFVGNTMGLCKARFTPAVRGEGGQLLKVLLSVEMIDEEVAELRDKVNIEETILGCISCMNNEKDARLSIDKLLKIIAEYYNCDRTYIITLDNDKHTVGEAFEWCEPGAIRRTDYDGDTIYELLKGWSEHMMVKDEVNHIKDKTQLYEIFTRETVNELELDSVMGYPVLDSDGEVIGVMGIDNVRYNTESTILMKTAASILLEEMAKLEYTKELYDLSYTDKMTGVGNRHAYLRDLAEFNEKHRANVGVVFADVNGLKRTNDEQGHEAGDRLLISATEILTSHFAEDNCHHYRVGGDEFVVFIDNIQEDAFNAQVDRLISDNAEQMIVSVGGAWVDKCSDLELQVKLADENMYERKREYYRTRGVERRGHKGNQ